MTTYKDYGQNKTTDMKTEPTEEMREKIERLFEFTDEDIHQIEKLQLAKKYFVEGYNEAMRWRDPEEELPEFNKEDYPNGDYKRYLIKVVKGSISTRIYVTVGWLISANRWNVEMDWVSVIGWRPIE